MLSIRPAQFFAYGLIASLIGLTIATVWQWGPFAVFGVGLIPLIAYHIYLGLKVKQNISQNTIDSVYYFGFIVTIMTLGLSTIWYSIPEGTSLGGIEIMPKGKKNVLTIAYQFGLGLFATAYALFARMQLMATSERFEENDPAALIDEYVSKVRHVVAQIELSATSFQQFSESIEARTRHAVETSVTDATVAFRDAVVRTAEEARNAIKEYSRALAQLNIESDVEGMRKQAKSLVNQLAELGNRLSLFGGSLDDVDMSFKKSASATKSFSSEVQGATANMHGIAQFATNLSNIRESYTMLGEQASTLNQDIMRLEGSFMNLVRAIETTTTEVNESVKRNAEQSKKSADLLTKSMVRMVDFIIQETGKK